MPCKPNEVISLVGELFFLKDASSNFKKDFEDRMELIRENLSTCSVGKGTKRNGPKRPPSKYNLHMKQCLLGKKGQGNHKDNFSNCVKEWKKKK